MASEIKANKISPATGTAFTLVILGIRLLSRQVPL